jgi:apoptosis-inducing factor 2
MNARRVVVIGGGYAGTRLARELDGVADVTLVDRKEAFFHRIASLRASVRKEWTQAPFVSYGSLLANGRVVRDTVTGLDPGAGVVLLESGRRLPYDVAVIATGAEYREPARFAGATVAEAAAAFHASQERFGAAASVLVVGGGPAGVELSAEIKHAHPGTRVTLVHAGERLLDGDHTPRLGRRALERLRAIGVDVRLGERVPQADSGGRTVTSAGAVIEADAVVWATGTTPNTGWLRDNDGWLDAAGRVKVDSFLRAGGRPDVFAVGDVNDVAEPKLAQWAVAQGKTTARNVRAVLDGKPPAARYAPARAKMMGVPLGADDGLMLLPLSPRGVVAGAWLARPAKSRGLFTGMFRKALGQPARWRVLRFYLLYAAFPPLRGGRRRGVDGTRGRPGGRLGAFGAVPAADAAVPPHHPRDATLAGPGLPGLPGRAVAPQPAARRRARRAPRRPADRRRAVIAARPDAAHRQRRARRPRPRGLRAAPAGSG